METEVIKVAGCARREDDSALCEYTNKNCRVKTGTWVGGPDGRARKHGHGVAAALATRDGRTNAGQLVLMGAFDGNGSGNVVWLGLTVEVQRFGGRCCQKQATRSVLYGDESQSAV